MRRVEALVFDMDGTMVDSMPWHARAWVEFARRRELAVDVVWPPVLAPVDFNAYINGVSRTASELYGDEAGEGEKGQEQP